MDITHTSVARTKHLIGRVEYVNWQAYYELKKEAEDAAVRKAQSKVKK